MTGREKLSVNMIVIRAIAMVIALMLCLPVLSACSPMNDAEKNVSNELKTLQSSDYVGAEVTDLRDSLSEEGKENFDGFLKKLKDFDFEITGSEEDDSKDDDYTLVSVKIRTYDFGREYIAAWTEFLKSHENAQSDDMTDFYEMLFDRLDSLSEKDRINYIKIVCIDPLDNGEWIANIKENEELQDAIFGGMLTGMKELAAE